MKYKHTIALIWTQYTLMLYMLVADDWKKTNLFLYQGRIKEDIIQRIHDVGGRFFGGYRMTAYACNSSKNIFARVLKKILYLVIEKLVICWIYFIGAKNIKCYGYESIFCNTKFLDAGCSFSVLEDGESTYMEHLDAEKFWSMMRGQYVSGKYLPGGWADAVEEVILSGRKKVPKGLESKARIIDLSNIWRDCSENKRREILYVFQFDIDYWKKIIASGRDIVLLTTNPFVCGINSDGWVALYEEIISYYDRNRIIIKPHPADTIEYEKVFPDCPVVRQVFPFEICYFTQLPLKKIIGVKCTALYGIWPDNMVDNYMELLEKYREIK